MRSPAGADIEPLRFETDAQQAFLRPSPRRRRFEHLVEMWREAYTRRPVVAIKADPLAPFGPAVRAWFEATFEAPTPAQIGGLGGHRARSPHADPCSDRQRQDPRRVPVVPGPPRGTPETGSDQGAARHRPRALRQPAQGADLRRRAQPPRPARRHRPRGRPPGRCTPSIHVASRTGDTPADERRDLVRHPPDILVTTPESLYLLLTSQAGDGSGHRARDRRRGPRDRRDKARRAPGAEPGAPRASPGAGHGANPAHRPQRHPATARDHREVPRRDR